MQLVQFCAKMKIFGLAEVKREMQLKKSLNDLYIYIYIFLLEQMFKELSTLNLMYLVKMLRTYIKLD